MTRQIQVPNDYFAKCAAKEYTDDAGMALIRELAQNSADAGATEVSFSFKPNNVLVCTDNGHGMNLQQMQRRLLTPLASEKAEGAVGGFGKAKELILFGNPGWAVTSKDAHIAGSFLSVESECSALEEKCETTFNLTLPPTLWNAAKREAGRFLRSSERPGVTFYLTIDVACEVVNCEVKLPKRCTKDFGFCKVYLNRDNDDTRVYLRTGGLLTSVKHAYHPRSVGQVIIEVQGKSSELLTPARDNFRSSAHRTLVESWLELLMVDAKRQLSEDIGDEVLFFDAEEAQPIAGARAALPIHEGQYVDVQFKTIDNAPMEQAALKQLAQVPGMEECLTALAARSSAPVVKSKRVRQSFNFGILARELPAVKHFTVHTGSKEQGKLGSKWLMKHLSDALCLLAAWATAVQACAKAAALKTDAVGFTFKKDAEAEYIGTGAGRVAILLNPMAGIDVNSPWLVEELLDRCYHELAHQRGGVYHDEAFIGHETTVRRACRSHALRGAIARALRTGEVQTVEEES